MMSRCGFVIDSRFGNKKAKSTGSAIISAVSASISRLECAENGVGFGSSHVNGENFQQGEGAFRENSSSAPQLKQFMKRLRNDQARPKGRLF